MPEPAGGSDQALSRRVRTRPRLADAAAATARLLDLTDALGGAGELLAHPRVRGLVAGIADHSPYLWHLILADPERFARMLRASPEDQLDEVLAALRIGNDAQDDEAALMRRLRLAKQEVALLVALADLGGVWGLDETMQALSRAADAFIDAALVHLLRKAVAAGRLRSDTPDDPCADCPIAVLGLGKLGGCELNYSSDVDLIVVFDAASAALIDPDRAKPLFVRIVQDLVRLLQAPTADGYVLRVDLRLRPDPGSTAVAISIASAHLYYEAFGQNWERAAMIKARPVAGDLRLGARFIADLAPFVWRKYFDYAAIADIHAMKRQIHAAKGHGEIAVAGHNVKLGRGGIREIEFFVQTQQLIFGGKRPDLRGSRTLPMLRQLRRDRWIGGHALADLTRAYDFLRRVEHRLQMIADEQTHRLPREEAALERFAAFCGFRSAARFGAVLTRHLAAVAHHYRMLFENEPTLGDAGGSLVFTGVEDDPETLETLAALGYRQPARIAETIRGWHAGARPAVASARTREALTNLVPKLLVTFGKGLDPDAAVATLDAAFQRLPAAAELFAILAGNEALRALFGDVLASAPELAAIIAVRPHLLDGVLDRTGTISRDADEVEARAAAVVRTAGTTEDFLDAVRDFFHEEHFLIGTALLAGDVDPEDAGPAYSALATAIVRIVLGKVRTAFAAEEGDIPQSRVAVVAMGKLGSREMTATSDLDLVLLYTFDPAQPDADGRRRLHASQYFGRLAQRLISHLTVATRRGKLYDVDMRLRPSGRQGPLATKLTAFIAYQAEEAATWERLALTRARAIAGDESLLVEVGEGLNALLRRPAVATAAQDVRSMRALIAKEKPPRGDWDLKLVSGGLVDLEFIAQYLVLRHAAASPGILLTATADVLAAAGRLGVLDIGAAARLIAAHGLLSGVMQILRIALPADKDLAAVGPALKQKVAAFVGLPDFGSLDAEVRAARQAVRETFRAVLSEG